MMSGKEGDKERIVRKIITHNPVQTTAELLVIILTVVILFTI